MATPYVLTTTLKIQNDPGSLKAVTSEIARELRNVVGNIDFKVSSSTISGIQNISRATKDLSGNLASVSSSAKEGASAIEAFGAQTALAARRFAAFAVGPGALAAIAYGFKNALGEAFAFEKELIRLEQISGSSKRGLDDVVDSVTNLSQSLGVSSRGLLEVATTLRQAGIELKDLPVALEAVAKASLAPTFGNMEDAAQGALALFKQFGVQANELEGTFGSINAVASRFATEAQEINTAISRTGAAFKAAGGSVNELVALFSAVRGTTRETAESVSTGLRTIFSRLQRSSTIDSLQQLGIELRVTRQEALKLGDISLEGNFIGAFEAAKRLGEALKNLSTTDPRFANIAEQLGGYRQIEKTIPLLQQMTTAQSALNVAMAGSASLNSSAEKAQEGFLNQVTKLKEEIFGLGRILAEDTGFRRFVDLLVDSASAIVKVTGALAPLLPLLAAFGAAKAFGAAAPFVSGFAQRIAKPVLFAEGGVVPGSGSGDTVHANMTPGEFVIKKASAQKIGYDKLHEMNHYADGGLADYASSAPLRKQMAKKANEDKIYQMLDKIRKENEERKLLQAAQGYASGGFIDNLNEMKRRVPSRKNSMYHLGSDQPEVSLRAIKLASQTNAESLKSFIPDDAKYLSHGVEALVLKSESENAVYRIVPTTESKPTSNKQRRQEAFKGRPNHPNILQPLATKDVGNLHIEKLPFINKFGLGDDYQNVKDLELSLFDSGYIVGDVMHHNNVAYVNGVPTLIDPGFIRKTTDELPSVDSFPNPMSSNAKANFFKKSDFKPDSDFKNLMGLAHGGSTDSIPAMLTPGEFVFSRQAASRIGGANLRAMNQGGVAHFAKGGPVQYLEDGSESVIQQPQSNSSKVKFRYVEDTKAPTTAPISSAPVPFANAVVNGQSGGLSNLLSQAGVGPTEFNALISEIRYNASSNKNFATILRNGGSVVVEVIDGFTKLKGAVNETQKTIERHVINENGQEYQKGTGYGNYNRYTAGGQFVGPSPLEGFNLNKYTSGSGQGYSPYRNTTPEGQFVGPVAPYTPSRTYTSGANVLGSLKYPTPYNVGQGYQPIPGLDGGDLNHSSLVTDLLRTSSSFKLATKPDTTGGIYNFSKDNIGAFSPINPNKRKELLFSDVIHEETTKSILKATGTTVENVSQDTINIQTKKNYDRILKELTNAEANLIRATTPGITAEESHKRAAENVAKELEKEALVIREASGKHILASTAENAAKNGIPYVPGQSFRGPGNTFGTLNPFTQTGRQGLGKLVSNPNFAFGASILGSYVASGIDSNLPTASDAVASNNTIGLRAGKGASGFIGGAATGAFAGSLLGASTGPLAPLAVPIGAAVGGLLGFASAISTVNKEINDVKLGNSVKDIELNLRRFSENLEGFAEFKASASTSINDIRENNLSNANSQASGYLTGFDPQAFGQIYNKLNNETIGAAAPSIAQALSKQAQDIGKASLGKNLDDVKQNFVRANTDLIGVIASVNKVDPKVFEKQFTKSIDDGLRSATRDKQEKEVNNFVIGLERLSSSMEAAVAATSDLQAKFKGIAALSSGQLDPTHLNSISSKLNPLNPDRGAFLGALNTTAQGLGVGGTQFAEQGRAAQAVANAVAEVLPTLIREAGNTEPGNLTANLRKNIEGSIGADAKLPEFKRAITLLIQEIGSVNVSDELKKSGNDASKFVENVLKPIIAGFADNAQKIAKLQEQAGNNFIDGLTVINQHINKFNEEADKFNQINLSGARFGAGLEAQRLGRPSQALDLLSLGQLQQPFLQRQANLVGPGIDPLDPTAIGNRLRDVNSRIPQAKANVEATRGTPQFAQFANELEKLKAQSLNLTSALKGLTEAANLNSAIQEKLNRIEDNRAGREALLGRYVESDAAGRAEIERGLLLIQATTGIDKKGKLKADIGQLSIPDQGLARRTALSGGKGEILINGKSVALDDIARSQLENVPGANGTLLGPNQQAQKDALQNQQAANFGKAAEAQDEILQNQSTFLDDLKGTLLDLQKQYFNDLRAIDQQRLIAIASSAQISAADNDRKLIGRKKDFGILNDSGITDDSSLSYAKANQDKLLQYFSFAQKEQTANAAAASFDPDQIKDFSTKGISESLRKQFKNTVSEEDIGKIAISYKNNRNFVDQNVGQGGPDVSDKVLLSQSVQGQLRKTADEQYNKKADIFAQLPDSVNKDKLPGNLPGNVSVDQFSKALSSFDTSANTLKDFPAELLKASQALTKAAADLKAAQQPVKPFAMGGATRGTDIIPAMLSPGEFIVNSKSAASNMALLHKINSSGGAAVHMAEGGNPLDAIDFDKVKRNSDPDNPFNQKAGPKTSFDFGSPEGFAAARKARDTASDNPFNEKPDSSINQKFLLGNLDELDHKTFRRKKKAEGIGGLPSIDDIVTAQYINAGRSLVERQVASQVIDPFAPFGLGKAGIESQANLSLGSLQRKEKADRESLKRLPFKFQQLFDQERARRNAPQYIPIPKRFASGGSVNGEDNIPAMLSEGEYVVNRDAVRNFGVGNLNRINHYRDGGAVLTNNPLQTENDGGSSSPANKFNSAIIDGLNNTFKLFTDTSSLLTKNFVLFDGAASKLGGILEKFPNKISIEGNQTLTVVINGAETINKIMPELKNYVEGTIEDSLNKMIKDKFPDA